MELKMIKLTNEQLEDILKIEPTDEGKLICEELLCRRKAMLVMDKAFEEILVEVGTSTLTNKIVTKALAESAKLMGEG